MKKIILSMVALIAAFMITLTPIYAELSLPQVFSWEDEIARDFNGEPITDCWAYDPSQETEKFVKLNNEGKLVEQKASYEEETNTEETQSTGWVSLEAILPDNLKGYDVIVSITGPDYYEFKLYEINDYKSTQEVLVGTYKIDMAMIAGDYKGEYPATFESEIRVYENSTAAVLKVDFKGEEIDENTKNSTEMSNTEEDNNQTETKDIIIEEKEGLTLAQKIGIAIIAVIVGAGAFIFKKLKDNE